MTDADTGKTLFRPGGISYVQIPASDPRASAAFYEGVFGWNIRGRDTSHVSFDDGSAGVSGAFIPGREISREPGILPYIYVSAIDATLAAIVEHGGTIAQEPYPEGDLWVATFRDPAGNVIGVWQHGER